VVDQTGAESLVVIMRHLLNEAYRAGTMDLKIEVEDLLRRVKMAEYLKRSADRYAAEADVAAQEAAAELAQAKADIARLEATAAKLTLALRDADEKNAAERRAGREDAARDQEQDRIDEQWSVWLTMPGGITVVTLADEQDDEPLGAVADIRRYDSDEEWARDYAANPPEGTLKAQVRRRTRTHWSAWQPVDQLGVQPTEEQRARDEDQKRDEEQR
jgi:hypothetical protein